MKSKAGNYMVAVILPLVMLVAASQITISGNIELKEARRMTHPALGMEDCLSCHNDTEQAWPPNHYRYITNTCIGCHKS